LPDNPIGLARRFLQKYLDPMERAANFEELDVDEYRQNAQGDKDISFGHRIPKRDASSAI
jgi:hypothetical protein